MCHGNSYPKYDLTGQLRVLTKCQKRKVKNASPFKRKRHALELKVKCAKCKVVQLDSWSLAEWVKRGEANVQVELSSDQCPVCAMSECTECPTRYTQAGRDQWLRWLSLVWMFLCFTKWINQLPTQDAIIDVQVFFSLWCTCLSLSLPLSPRFAYTRITTWKKLQYIWFSEGRKNTD